MNRTNIDWPSLGYSWNPILGCSNSCPYCYAKKISDRFKMVTDFTQPTWFPQRIDEPTKVKKPATIFVGSMCDIFSEGVSRTWVHHIIETTRNCPQHTFMFLTKNPYDYITYKWGSNCVLGTTIESQGKINRVVQLAENRDNKLFVSIEPILGDFTNVNFYDMDFIIVGADSSKGAKVPPLEWVRSIDHKNIWYKNNLRKHYPELVNPSVT